MNAYLDHKSTTDNEKAQALANFFHTVFSKCCNSDESLLDSESFIRTGRTLTGMYFYPDGIAKVLKSMKPSITEPHDGIPSLVFRKCAKFLSKPLTHIFNISLILGEVPNV